MASSDINRVVLVGNLTRDPELKQIQSGTSICTFSIASNYVYGSGNEKKENVSYFNCLFWGKGGEVFAQYAKKGQKVSVDGRLQQRRWQDKDGNNRQIVEIVVDNFQFLSFVDDSKKNETQSGYTPPTAMADPNSNYTPSESFNSEDIPF